MASQLVFDPNKKKEGVFTPQFGQQTGIVNQPQQQQAPQGSGSFTNLQKLLGANVGQGQQMAGQMGQMAQQQSQGVQKLQEKAQQNVGGILNEERTNQSQAQAIGEAVKATKDASGVNQLFNQYGNQLSTLADDKTRMEEAGQTLATQGGQAATALGGLKGTQSGFGSEAGRAGILSQIMRKPTYSRGAQALDQALVQTEGRDTLQNTRQQLLQDISAAGGRQEGLMGLAKDISGLTTSASDISKQLKESLGGVGKGLEANLAKTAEERTAQAQEETQKAIQRINTGNATDEDLAMLGVTGTTKTYGQDLATLLKDKFTPAQFRKEDVISQQDVDAFGKLQGILGTGPGYKTPTEQKAAYSLTPEGQTAIAQTLGQARDAYLTTGKSRGFNEAEMETGTIGDWQNPYKDTGVKNKEGISDYLRSNIGNTLNELKKDPTLGNMAGAFGEFEAEMKSAKTPEELMGVLQKVRSSLPNTSAHNVGEDSYSSTKTGLDMLGSATNQMLSSVAAHEARQKQLNELYKGGTFRGISSQLQGDKLPGGKELVGTVGAKKTPTGKTGPTGGLKY